MDTPHACIFCEIVAGRAEASVIYEDDRILAFLDLRPIHPGECVVIPKPHIDHFTDIPDELAAHLMVIAQQIGRKLRKAFAPQRVGMVVHGFGVPHAHLILVPQHHHTDITSGRHVYLEEGQIKFGLKHIPRVPREELDRLAQRLRQLE